MPYITIDADVDLTDFDTEDLIDELESRGHDVDSVIPLEQKQLIEKIYLKRRQGKPFDAEIDQLIYDVLGKVI